MSRELSQAERSGPRTAFVGRRGELATLLTHLAAAGRGEGHVVLVAGEPGIGKTRLLTELAERARGRGWQVLVGQADEAEGMPPYLPFSNALRAYVRAAPLAALRAQLGEEAPTVALLLREVRRRLPGLPPNRPLRPEDERYRLLDSVSEFLLAIAHAAGLAALADGPAPDAEAPLPPPAEDQPRTGLLLCLDDLHWADTPSLLLLQHLARRLADAPLLVVGSYRPGDVVRTHPLAAILLRLRREGLAERLLLAALTVDEAAALIAALTGRPVAPAVATTIHHETAGNPFFLEEVVRHLQAEGRDLGDPRAVASTWSIPDGVRQMIAGRVARLSPLAQRLLQAGALLGEGFRFDVLGQLLEAEVVQLLDAMDEVLTTGLLYEAGDVYHFGHALIRETLYTELSLVRRQHLHQMAAETLERLYAADFEAHVAVLARHYRLAGPAAAEKALEYARRAADAAAAVSAWEEAAGHRQAALALIGPARTLERCELLLALGEAQTYAGDNDAARESFQTAASSARALGAGQQTGVLLARAALGVGLTNGGETPGTVDALLVELLRDALDSLTNGDDGLRARLLAALARALHWSDRPQESVTLSREAVALARRGGQPAALIEALSASTFTRWGPELPVEPLAFSAECLALARQSADRECLLEVYQWRIPELLRAGEREAAEADVEAHARLAQAVRIPPHLLRSATFRVCLALLDGRFADAERLVEQGYAIGQSGRIWRAELLRLAQVYAIREQQGRLPEARTAVEAIVDGYPGLAVQFGCALAYVQAELGQLGEARLVLENRAADAFASLRRDQNWISAAGALAQVCVVLDDRERAATLYELLCPYPGWANVRAGGIAVFGSVPYFLGLLATLLGHWGAAARHFEAALALHARLRARPWLARTQYAYAAMLVRRGRAEERGRAGALLADALATARELSMTRLADQTAALAPGPGPESGARPGARESAAYPDGLTAREVEVLGLLARGLTNKQIAASLVVSPNTVHQHLVNVYAKIGASRRTEATAYAIQRGLLQLDHSV
jgi:DNA-binding CsgD family transcriptional regulator